MANTQKLYLRHVPPKTALLLELPVRVHDLLGLHGGKPLGYDLQRHYLDVSRLWRHTRFRQRLNTQRS